MIDEFQIHISEDPEETMDFPMDFPMKYGGFQSINEKARSPWSRFGVGTTKLDVF